MADGACVLFVFALLRRRTNAVVAVLQSPKHSHGMVYPDGLGSGLTGEQLAVGFGPDGADYGGVAAAAGGAWARKVAQASALKETFEEAVRVVLEERRCAVVECIVPSI